MVCVTAASAESQSGAEAAETAPATNTERLLSFELEIGLAVLLLSEIEIGSAVLLYLSLVV